MCEVHLEEQPIALEICSKCRVAKGLWEFSKGKNGKNGLKSWCKECDAARLKVAGEKNKARETVVIPERKTCSGCKTEKPGPAFSKNKDNKDGLQVYCKECRRWTQIMSLYGLSPEQYNATLEAQGGACAICKWIPGLEDSDPDVDHIHGTEIVRGLLHGKCNRGLGFFKDNVTVILKAIDYLNGPTTGIAYKVKLDKAIKEQILASQGYVCKICSADLHNKKACVDHDHIAMMIRGILCDGCNCGLGQFDDSIILLANAISYLQKYESRQCLSTPSP